MTWLNRMLVESPVYYALCISEKRYREVLKDMHIKRGDAPEWILHSNAGATTHFFENPEGSSCAVVCIDPKRAPSHHQSLALLVHEAVHIWQEIKAKLGEKEPSKEFEAYSIQRMALEMFDAYEEQMK